MSAARLREARASGQAGWAWRLLLLACAGTLTAQSEAQPDIKIRLVPTVADGVFLEGAPVAMRATLRSVSGQARKGRLSWRLYDHDELVGQAASRQTIEAQGETVVTGKLQPPGPGFYFVECRYQSPGEVDAVARMRVGSDPEQIERPLTARPDLQDFWRETLDELGQVKPRYMVTHQPERSNDERDLYLVEMRSLGDVRVRGWLQVPKKAGPHATILRVPGYSGNMRPTSDDPDMVVFSFNIRGHGNSQQDVSGAKQDYWVRGLDDKESYYYRGAYADCIRAVDYLCTREDVDQDRLVIWGASQGGGLSWMTAALDPRIDACIADIPWLADWVGYFRLTDWPEMNSWVAARPERTWPSTYETLSYFDTMNMADRITCPVLMRVGLQDRICPPSTSFATYNRIAGPKNFLVYPNAGHGIGRRHRGDVDAFLGRVFD
ncbi:MAG: alpha/beta fold hydrolase [Planctomycetota bacterium]|nr:alpha/beta fold hydrolase [Planctomycetota bacterium]